jgi:hypothetical protein
MRVPVLLFISLVVFFGCGSENRPGAPENGAGADSAVQDGTQTMTDTVKPVRERPKPKAGFDLQAFIQSADSLVSIMAGESVRFRYVITARLDTTKGNFTMLSPSDAEKIQHYRLIANKGDGKWDIGILRIEYKAGDNLNKAYAISSRKIQMGNGSSNDFVFKYPSQLVWIYAGCSYSKVKMQELRSNLLRDLSIGDIAGTASRMCR